MKKMVTSFVRTNLFFHNQDLCFENFCFQKKNWNACILFQNVLYHILEKRNLHGQALAAPSDGRKYWLPVLRKKFNLGFFQRKIDNIDFRVTFQEPKSRIWDGLNLLAIMTMLKVNKNERMLKRMKN